MAGKGRSQRVKLAQWALSLVSRAAWKGFRRGLQAPQQMACMDYLHIKTLCKCNAVVTWKAQTHMQAGFYIYINMEPKSIKLKYFAPSSLICPHLFLWCRLLCFGVFTFKMWSRPWDWAWYWGNVCDSCSSQLTHWSWVRPNMILIYFLF